MVLLNDIAVRGTPAGCWLVYIAVDDPAFRWAGSCHLAAVVGCSRACLRQLVTESNACAISEINGCKYKGKP